MGGQLARALDDEMFEKFSAKLVKGLATDNTQSDLTSSRKPFSPPEGDDLLGRLLLERGLGLGGGAGEQIDRAAFLSIQFSTRCWIGM